MAQLGLWRVCLGFFSFRRPVEWLRAVSLEALVFLEGSWAISSEFARGLWVLGSPLVFWLCYWGAWASAYYAGLPLLLPFLDLLLRGFGKIQMTQIIRFAIYVHKVGNADAKYYEIQF